MIVETKRTDAPLTVTLICLFGLLIGRARVGALLASGRSVSGIDSGRTFWIRAADLDSEFLPIATLDALEGSHWSLFVTAALRGGEGRGDASALNALAATWTFQSEYVRGEGVIAPPRHYARAFEALERFALAPSIVILGGTPTLGGGFSITALFGLSEPIDLRADSGEVRALELLRRLAQTLGADEFEPGLRPHEIVVPLPGSAVRQGAGLDVVRVPICEPDRIYPLDEFQSALVTPVETIQHPKGKS